MEVFTDRFIPFLSIYKYGLNGTIAGEPSEYIAKPQKYEFAPLLKRLLLNKSPNEAKSFDEVPFDLYCPSMKDKLKKGVCSKCGRYWPSAAAMLRHKKCHKDEENDEVDCEVLDDDDNTLAYQVNEGNENDRMPIFDNVFDKLASPSIEDDE